MMTQKTERIQYPKPMPQGDDGKRPKTLKPGINYLVIFSGRQPLKELKRSHKTGKMVLD